MPASENPPLTSAEQVFLQALNDEGVPFLVVGLGAAVLQGADTATQDLDLWFGPSSGAGIRAAALRAGGFYAERTEPPMVGGPGLERIDVVTHCHGLRSFETEYRRSLVFTLDDLALRVLPLERIIASKQATRRPKDLAAIEQLRAALAVTKEREGIKEREGAAKARGRTVPLTPGSTPTRQRRTRRTAR